MKASMSLALQRRGKLKQPVSSSCSMSAMAEGEFFNVVRFFQLFGL
jgi:hypothetical protein